MCDSGKKNRILLNPLLSMVIVVSFSLPAEARYSGGSGTAEDPYQIGLYIDLIRLGENRDDYDKCFLLIADIDLDPSLPGRRIFTSAVVGRRSRPFTGTFDGGGYTIQNLTISGYGYLGLFGKLDAGSQIHHLGVVDVNVTGTDDCVGALTGDGGPGVVSFCYSTGTVSGRDRIGGLAGSGQLNFCYSDGIVTGRDWVGGLAGAGRLNCCYSDGIVTGNKNVGGLFGGGSGLNCYTSSTVSGNSQVGGIAGSGSASNCYSTGSVSGHEYVSGLIGGWGTASHCFWNTDTSNLPQIADGNGIGSLRMQDGNTYLDAGWDFLGESKNGLSEIWQIPEDGGYPVLSIFNGYNMLKLLGQGVAGDPYLISSPSDLGVVMYHDPYAHYKLTGDLDLSGITWGTPVIPEFLGTFHGSGFTIGSLTIKATGSVGLFRYLGEDAQVLDLGVVDADITGLGGNCGILAGTNWGYVANCYSSGTITGDSAVGGLIGINIAGDDVSSSNEMITQCYSAAIVSGELFVGGLAGSNRGRIERCFSTGPVLGGSKTGGLVGNNNSTGSSDATKAIITNCYSIGAVSGDAFVGGLGGENDDEHAYVTNCYSAGRVTGSEDTGGLIGKSQEVYVEGIDRRVSNCFWDTQSSGQLTSDGGIGLTTAQMKDIETYSLNGWAVNANWVIAPDKGYPHLAWEGTPGEPISEPTLDWLGGTGTVEDPYQLADANQLIVISQASILWERHFKLMAEIDLSGITWSRAVIPIFSGSLNGSGFALRGLTITGQDFLGLFGEIEPGAKVYAVELADANVTATGNWIGTLAGLNHGALARCSSSGLVTGRADVGGLVGENNGSISNSQNTGTTSAEERVGGLVGSNWGSVILSCGMGTVSGDQRVGGLVGSNGQWRWGRFGIGHIFNCFSNCRTSGHSTVGGLVGDNLSYVANCYSSGLVEGDSSVGGLMGDDGNINFGRGEAFSCFWNKDTSGQSFSAGGTGLTTAKSQNIDTYISAGWDMADEVRNGICDYWEMSPGGQPRLRLNLGNSSDMWAGSGTVHEPYLIQDAYDLGVMWIDPAAHYRLSASIDLSGISWSLPVVPVFSGPLDGDSLFISNYHIAGRGYLGLFGQLVQNAEISNLGLEAVNVAGTNDYIGSFAGENSGSVASCYNSGMVRGDSSVGGLVGWNRGIITASYNTCTVHGESQMEKYTARASGGITGRNAGSILESYNAGMIYGDNSVGGIVGSNSGNITTSYNRGMVQGERNVGGLVGYDNDGSVATSYSTASVIGEENIGGLIGNNYKNTNTSFWDRESSGLYSSDGGTGLSTTRMQSVSTFLAAGWDFVDETANGTEDIWWIDEGQDYPKLWWQARPCGSFPMALYPEIGSVQVPQPLVLSWQPGAWATHHDVYLGPNENTVTYAAIGNPDVYQGHIPAETHTYEPGMLAYGETYYWRIDGVNETEAGLGCRGDTWRFTTADFIMDYSPANDTAGVRWPAQLSWTPGGPALWYDVYFGEDEDSVAQATPDISAIYRGRQMADQTTFSTGKLQPFNTHFWRIDGVDELDAQRLWKGKVQQFTSAGPAVDQYPPDSALKVSRPVILRWKAGGPGLGYDVYFGETRRAVVQATPESTGIYQGQQASGQTSFDPGYLKPGTTYYWRIDGVDTDNPENLWKGTIVKFTTAISR